MCIRARRGTEGPSVEGREREREMNGVGKREESERCDLKIQIYRTQERVLPVFTICAYRFSVYSDAFTL